MVVTDATSILVEEREGYTWAFVHVIVARPLLDVFQFWRDPVNLTRFLGGLRAVVLLGRDDSLWRVGDDLEHPESWVVRASVDEHDTDILWRAIGPAEGTMSALCTCSSRTDGEGSMLDWTLRLRSGAATVALLGEDPQAAVWADTSRFLQIMGADDGRGRPPDRFVEVRSAVRA